MKESLTTRQFVLWTLKVHTNRNDRTSNDSTIVSLSYKITHAIKKSSSDLFDNRIFALSCAKCNSTADSILYLYVLMHYAVSRFFQIWKNSVLYHKVSYSIKPPQMLKYQMFEPKEVWWSIGSSPCFQIARPEFNSRPGASPVLRILKLYHSRPFVFFLILFFLYIKPCKVFVPFCHNIQKDNSF